MERVIFIWDNWSKKSDLDESCAGVSRGASSKLGWHNSDSRRGSHANRWSHIDTVRLLVWSGHAGWMRGLHLDWINAFRIGQKANQRCDTSERGRSWDCFRMSRISEPFNPFTSRRRITVYWWVRSLASAARANCFGIGDPSTTRTATSSTAAE